MAGLRFAVLYVASCLLLLLLLGASGSSSRQPAVYGVGDDTGWAAPPGNGAQTPDKQATRDRFFVGDVLDFKNSNHSVLLVRQGDYERCSAASPVRRFAGGGGGGDDTRFTLALPGLFYFISAAPARCEAGQRMAVRAVAARSPLSGSPAPAPGTQLTATASSRRRPLSLAQMEAVAAAAAFVAGFIFTFLIVWLSVCCRA